jgi:hypothetical protein
MKTNVMRTMVKRNAAGGKLLLVATMLGLAVGSAQAYTGPLSPSIRVAIGSRGRSEDLACSVWQTLPTPGMGGILVRIEVPNDNTVKAIRLETASGDTTLAVTSSLPLLGQYETIIDTELTNCATTGTLLVEVEGELETKPATCPGILLPKGSGCSD